ncbi:MAG: CsbD family protein [Devosia sp.]|nr:CsbD family protein [Devosia sp.]
MHKDEVTGAGKQARGSIKEAVGKVTGDSKLQVDGAADKVEGKVQSKVGQVKDAARDALKK